MIFFVFLIEAEKKIGENRVRHQQRHVGAKAFTEAEARREVIHIGMSHGWNVKSLTLTDKVRMKEKKK